MPCTQKVIHTPLFRIWIYYGLNHDKAKWISKGQVKVAKQKAKAKRDGA